MKKIKKIAIRIKQEELLSFSLEFVFNLDKKQIKLLGKLLEMEVMQTHTILCNSNT